MSSSPPTPHIAVFGAAGRTGRLVAAELLDRGCRVSALASAPGRLDPRPGLREVIGDALDPLAVWEAVEGVDAAVVALGPRPGEPPLALARATANVVAALRSPDHAPEADAESPDPHPGSVRARPILAPAPDVSPDPAPPPAPPPRSPRLVVLTGAMIGHPPQYLPWLYRVMLALFPPGVRSQIADRRAQERVVQGSGLSWTLVRPPRLTDAPPGVWRCGPDLPIRARDTASRADVAAFLADLALSEEFSGQGVAVVSGEGG